MLIRRLFIQNVINEEIKINSGVPLHLFIENFVSCEATINLKPAYKILRLSAKELGGYPLFTSTIY